MYNELVEEWKDSHPCSVNTQRLGARKSKCNKWKYKTVFVRTICIQRCLALQSAAIYIN